VSTGWAERRIDELSLLGSKCDTTDLSHNPRFSDKSVKGASEALADFVFASIREKCLVLKNILAVASLAALVLLVATPSHIDAKPGPGCAVRSNGCTATDISFSPEPNPDPPVVPCLQGVTLYTLQATITCGIGFGTTVELLVCPVSSQPAGKLIDGQWHTFQPASGRTWQDVINDCDYLTYTVS